MPNKRSRRRVQHFFCPNCQQRLWRTGKSKYHLHYQNVSEIKQNLNTTRKKATFLAHQNSVYVDRDRWIEEFFCSEHGIVWLLISRQTDGNYSYRAAKERDWQKTGRTLEPRTANPSISEYSHRMSRSIYRQNSYYKNSRK